MFNLKRFILTRFTLAVFLEIQFQCDIYVIPESHFFPYVSVDNKLDEQVVEQSVADDTKNYEHLRMLTIPLKSVLI